MVKPIERYQLLRAIKRAMFEIAKDQEMMYQHTKLSKRMVVKKEGETYLISQDEIVFVEKVNRSCIIHTKHSTYKVNTTLGQY